MDRRFALSALSPAPRLSRRTALRGTGAGVAGAALALTGQAARAQDATPAGTPAAGTPAAGTPAAETPTDPVVASWPYVFQYDEFQFQFLIALGAVYERAADVGELFAAASQIADGDYDSWCATFSTLGDRVRAIAEVSEAAGNRVSAREAYLRASSYYAQAAFFTLGTSTPDQLLSVWEVHRDSFDRFAALLDVPAEQVSIPYEGTTLPGYALTVDDSGQPRPWLVMNNGSDGTVTDMWTQGAAAGLRRGWNVLIFDGPGQGAALYRQKLYFRPDWEAVLTPVVDWLVARDDVDAEQLAVMGISQGGFWVPRALAFEHRFAAAIADPGVFDVSTSWTAQLPAGTMEEYLNAPPDEQAQIAAGIDQGVEQYSAQDPTVRFTLTARMAPYGVTKLSELLLLVAKYTLSDVVGQIRTPVLVADPEGESFWPGQSAQLYNALPGPKELAPFTAAEGADLHGEPKATGLRAQVFFDWLARTTGGEMATPTA